MSIDPTIMRHLKCIKFAFRAFKSIPIWNVLGWLRAFKSPYMSGQQQHSPYINACRVNSNTLNLMCPYRLTGSCHKRQNPQAPTPKAPIRNRQTR